MAKRKQNNVMVDISYYPPDQLQRGLDEKTIFDLNDYVDDKSIGEEIKYRVSINLVKELVIQLDSMGHYVVVAKLNSPSEVFGDKIYVKI